MNEDSLYRLHVCKDKIGFEIIEGLYSGTVALLNFSDSIEEVEIEFVKIPDLLNGNLDDEEFNDTIDFIINEIIKDAIHHHNQESSSK